MDIILGVTKSERDRIMMNKADSSCKHTDRLRIDYDVEPAVCSVVSGALPVVSVVFLIVSVTG
jgi:hypothetical protein